MTIDLNSDQEGGFDAAMKPLLQVQEFIDQGRYSEADECFEQFAEHVAQRIEEFAKDPGFQEELLLSQLETQGRWPEVKQIYQARVAQNLGGPPFPLARAYYGLAKCCALLGDLKGAADQCAAATRLAREDDFPSLLALHLHHEGQIALERSQYEHAFNCFNEALENLEDKKSHDHIRAQCLIGRAKSWLQRNNPASAEADHREAWEYLAPMSAMEGACGVQAAFAEWWEVEARLWEESEERELFQHSWETAIQHRRQAIDAYGDPTFYLLNSLARTLFNAGQATKHFGDPKQAEFLLAESQALRRQVGLPPFTAQ
jgi:tetratricopeptide (TPR) repeat protein